MDQNFEYKYKKYKSKYLQSIANQDGGAKSKDDKKSTKKSSKKPNLTDEAQRSEHIFRVGCIKVEQKGDVTFNGNLCKEPAFRIRFRESEVKWVTIIKSLMRFVSKNLRMKDIKEVRLVKGKKTDKIKGDKIEGSLDLTKEPVYDEVKIIM